MISYAPGSSGTLDKHSSLVFHLLSGLKDLIPAGSRVAYCDYAVYQNVGDLLISKSIEHFFQINSNIVVDRYSIQNYGAATRKHFEKDVILVFQGGGNFGDLYPGFQRMRLAILSAHSASKAIILPQTMYYRHLTTLGRDAEMFANFPELTICLRDHHSYSMAKRYFSNKLRLLPDTAHLLQDQFGTKPSGLGELKFLRLDQGDYSMTGLGILPPDRSTFVDWPNFLTSREKAIIHGFANLHVLDGRTWHTSYPYLYWRPYRERLLKRAANLFLESGEVLTNRLHGLIFAIITRRKASIIESGYGKVSTYYETFLNDFDSVSLLSGVSNPDTSKRS